MTENLTPATAALTELLADVRDEHLTAPTPCGGITVGDLLDHVDSLSRAFTAAATKTHLPGGGAAPVPDASRLGPDWRDRLPARLTDLAAAWQAEAAWAGETEVGGGTMPAPVAGAAAFDEILVHGWDLAAALGRPYPGGDPALAGPIAFASVWVESVVAQSPAGSPGLFGPPMPVPADATPMDRLIARTGRDPAWRPQ